MMGTFIDDAIYNYLNTDAESANDVDLSLITQAVSAPIGVM